MWMITWSLAALPWAWLWWWKLARAHLTWISYGNLQNPVPPTPHSPLLPLYRSSLGRSPFSLQWAVNKTAIWKNFGFIFCKLECKNMSFHTSRQFLHSLDLRFIFYAHRGEVGWKCLCNRALNIFKSLGFSCTLSHGNVVWTSISTLLSSLLSSIYLIYHSACACFRT